MLGGIFQAARIEASHDKKNSLMFQLLSGFPESEDAIMSYRAACSAILNPSAQFSVEVERKEAESVRKV